MKATKDTQDYAASVLAGNASAIRHQTAEIQDLYKNPVLALDKVRAAYDDLMAAMDEVDVAKQAGIQSARTGIAQLSEMSTKLTQRALGMKAEAAPDLPSIEA
jgi:uncharacterized protein YaaN involved in tellurite resistance